MKLIVSALLGLLVFAGKASEGQSFESFSRKNTFEVFASGSDTSSHVLLGYARNRQLLTFGVGYARRLIHSSALDVSYLAEIHPVILESDPFVHTISEYHYALQGTSPPYQYDSSYDIVEKCVPTSGTYVLDAEDSIVYATGCGRRRTFAQAFAPIGFKLAGRTSHVLQPTFAGTLGYMYSNRPIPIGTAGSFNFAFDFGPGVEFYRGKQRSIAVEYRYHHFSNKGTAQNNPGVDNMMVKVSYNFGR